MSDSLEGESRSERTNHNIRIVIVLIGSGKPDDTRSNRDIIRQLVLVKTFNVKGIVTSKAFGRTNGSTKTSESRFYTCKKTQNITFSTKIGEGDPTPISPNISTSLTNQD